MQKITPCLWFNNNAEEAANFYCSIFKNSKVKQITHYPPSAAAASGQPAGSVMTVVFELDGQEFMGLNGGSVYKHSPAFSLMVNCKDQTELDSMWDKLSSGGGEVQCGWITDKYGISWQIVPDILGKLHDDAHPDKVDRVMQTVMKSVKLDIDSLQKAYDGK